ncbi:MAG: hypothetical protein J0L97_10770, partial [Alphaproteobacteria bacterium]|nr:hypothetical protein [Alphaproteobacteria bacterium]
LTSALSNPGTTSGGAVMASSTKITYYMSKGLVNEASKIINKTLSACGYTLPAASITAVTAKLNEATAAVTAQSAAIGSLSSSTSMTALNQALTNAVSIADSVKSALETVENQLRSNTTCFSDLAADRCRTNPSDCFIGDITIGGNSSMGDRPAGCSNPPNILTDNPACFRDGITSGTGGLTPFCKDDGTLRYTPSTPTDPFKPIADRSSPEYREEGYSNDYVVEQLESVAKSWLDIRETVTSGTQTVQSTRREILLGIPPKDWNLYPFISACRVANPAGTGSLIEKQTVAVIKSQRYPLGQAAVVWRVVPNAAGGPCVQLRASNWAAGTCTGSGNCQTQLDQRNCYQSYPYFGLACTTLQCVPLNEIEYFFNPTPNCGVPPGAP